VLISAYFHTINSWWGITELKCVCICKMLDKYWKIPFWKGCLYPNREIWRCLSYLLSQLWVIHIFKALQWTGNNLYLLILTHMPSFIEIAHFSQAQEPFSVCVSLSTSFSCVSTDVHILLPFSYWNAKVLLIYF
jgi:hypothetical protein